VASRTIAPEIHRCVRYDRVMRLAVMLLLATSGVALAGEHDATFAQQQGVAVDRVRGVHGFELPRGLDYTHALTGRFEHGEYTMAGVVLLACDTTQCQARRVGFGATDEIEILGVVDLEGAPGPLPTRRYLPAGRYRKLPGRGQMKFPVLAVQTTESRQADGMLKSGKKIAGKETRTRLHLISLVEADRASVVLHDTSDVRYPSGSGSSRTYRLERGEKAGPLELIATKVRHTAHDDRCRRPPPVEIRFRRDGRHFREIPAGHPPGCS
jgi:hypothetical protein